MNNLIRLLATVFMFVLNGAAVVLPINGLTTAELSSMLPTLITPAGFTFAIWSVIYLGIIIVTVLFLLRRVKFPAKLITWYAISAVVNGLWIVVWHYQNLHLSMILILILLVSLIIMDQIIKSHSLLIGHYRFVRNVFLLYFGRVQIATLLMATIYAIYQLQIIDSQNLMRPLVVVGLAGVSNIVVLRKERNIMTSLVALWALWGIINAQTTVAIVQVSRLVTIIILINAVVVTIRGYQKKAS